MDHTKFVDDVGADLYIENVNEADKMAHGDGYNTPSDEAYGDMMMGERPEQDGIDNAAYNNFFFS